MFSETSRWLRGFSRDSSQSGLLAAFAAFFIWGLLPLFWTTLDSVDAREILAHRVVWSFVSLVAYMYFRGTLGGALRLFGSPRIFWMLLLSGALLGCNWYLYIWAINSHQILEASLGYFINPLLNIVSGFIFFKERGTKAAWIAIFLACVGVMFQVVALGHFPWLALGLSTTFAAYAVLRKWVIVEAVPGLFIETIAMLPFAVFFLLLPEAHGNNAFFRGDITITLLLISTGVITTIPLFFFALGTRNLRMTTLGLMQYITPSMVFLLGIFFYKEPLSLKGAFTFACIWCALALYSWDSFRVHRQRKVQG